MSYKVIPISSEIAGRVRENLKSPQYGHPASIDLATGYGPCRSCLNTFIEGEEKRILFTYNSFAGLSGLPLPGPVFIHLEACEAFQAEGFPETIKNLPILFEGFGEESELLKREPVDRQRIDEQIKEILNLSGVLYINIRNSEAGCFIARIEPE